MRERFVRWLCRVCLRVFFARVEVAGLEKIPGDRPLMVVGNHQNSLIDPVLLIGFLPRYPKLLAKSTLWKVPFLRRLLDLGGAIPVYRRQDGVDSGLNVDTFSRCHEEMFREGTIALFPEGISHNEPALQELRTGAARIVLEAEAKRSGLGIRIVPVGLVFEARTRFRSRVLLQVGEPLDPAPEQRLHASEPREAVRALTARINEGLRAVTLNFDSWEQASVIERLAELFAEEEADTSGRAPLARSAALQRAFVRGYREFAAREPTRAHEIYRSIRRYDRLLGVLALRDSQVAREHRLRRAALFALRFAGILLLGLPMAAVGVLLNWLPYLVPGRVARRMADDPDEVASLKVFTAFFLFPVFWALEASLAAWRLGVWAGGAVLLLAPLTGYVAIKLRDRRHRLYDEARAHLLLARRGRLARELRSLRHAIVEQVSRVAGEYGSGE